MTEPHAWLNLCCQGAYAAGYEDGSAAGSDKAWQHAGAALAQLARTVQAAQSRHRSESDDQCELCYAVTDAYVSIDLGGIIEYSTPPTNRIPPHQR
jgi:hypothetical protein